MTKKQNTMTNLNVIPEIWKVINGYKFYLISNHGRVKSLARSKNCTDRILRNKIKKKGYLYISLLQNNSLKYFHIHRLVASAFIANPEKKSEVNHINCIKADNNLSNLEWCTHAENQKHARQNIIYKINPLKGFKHPKATPIIQKDLNGNEVYIWESVGFVRNYYKVSSIYTRNKNTLGFIWESCSKEYYLANKDNYKVIPALPIGYNARYRDLTLAKQKRIENISLITNDEIIEHGIKCYNLYGNVLRETYDLYSSTTKSPGYRYIQKRFGLLSNFRAQIYAKISTSLADAEMQKVWDRQ